MSKDYSTYFVKPSVREAGKRTREQTEVIRSQLEVSSRLFEIAKGRTYHIKTFGCQANERDTENIAGILEWIGYTENPDSETADVVILNTCAIRENAEEKVFGAIGALKNIKAKNPDFVFGICGCMVQQESIVERILTKHPHIDLIFGTHNIHRLGALLDSAYFNKERVVEVFSKEGEIYENLPDKRNDTLKAWVNIMFGCDKFCTYCIVPFTRGKERSRLKEDIIKEVIELKEKGYKEITLLGQNVNAYGQDLPINYKFADLLNDVAKTGIERIRFMTSHPWNFSQEMIDAIANNPNIMPHVHLPVQSGDETVLRRMARRYKVKEYQNLYDAIRKTIPNVAVTTDIIVGFPGETEEQFQKTLDMVEYCKFDNAFTFIYSQRIGTPAARMQDDVLPEVKKERFNRLVEKVNTYALARNKEYLGKTIKVLVEGKSKKNENILSGYSDTWKIVNFKGNKNLIGKIVDVRITNVKTFTLEGEAVGQS